MTSPIVTAKEIIDVSRERGFLAKQLYVIFTAPTNGMGPVMENLKPHLEFQELLEKRGIMFAAGPHWTDDEQRWDGEGIVVVRAGSLAEAQAISAEDPMHKSGARAYRVRPWFVNEGTVTVKLDYATGRFSMI